MQKRGIRPWLIEQQAKGKLYATVEELRAAFPETTHAALKMAVANAVKDGLMAYAWRGFYLILPPVYRSRGTLPPALYIDALMRHLKRPYCVALLNAAETYGAAHQKPMTFTVMTDNPPPRDRKSSTTHLAFVGNRAFTPALPAVLVRRIKVQTGYVTVSTPEYTALSLIMHAPSSGGMSHVLTVLEELLEACDFHRLSPELAQYVPTSCFQRLGFMVDALIGDTMVGEQIHRYLHTHCNTTIRRVVLDTSAPPSAPPGILNERWRIHVNNQLLPDSYDS